MSRYCRPDDMSGVAFPTRGESENGSHRCLTIALMCVCSAFILTYFYYGFSEIQNELFSMKQGSNPRGARREAGNAEIKPFAANLRNDIYSDDEARGSIYDIVKAAIWQYDADKTTKADFALESSGGAIVSTGDTEPFESVSRGASLFGIPICQPSNGPRQIIQPGVLPGECWAFSGTKGSVIVKLLGPVFIDSVSLEHISKDISPTGTIDTAPKQFSIWGLDSETDPGKLLGEFTYDADGPPLQTFQFEEESRKSYELIEFKVHSNHGNALFTCVYRLRVHGTLDSNN